MLNALVVVSLIVAQGSQPASAPASQPLSRPALPTSIKVGDSVTIPLKAVPPEGIALHLDVAFVEPLTITAVSYDADVAVGIEEAAGIILAEDDDSGAETNAHVVWTPTEAAHYTVWLRADSSHSGSATVCVSRSALKRKPAEPRLTAIGYWDLAQDRARTRKDSVRERVALEALAKLEGFADGAAVHAARAPRDAVVAAARAKLQESIRLQSEKALPAAREALNGALRGLLEHEGHAEDSVMSSLLSDVGAQAYALSALKDAATAWNATRAYRERTLPEDHPDLQRARLNHAITIAELGDLAGARVLLERVVNVFEQTLHADHPDLQAARQNLAGTILELGDPVGARVLLERVLDVKERTLPPDHPDLQTARQNLGATLKELDDFAGARALFERVLEVNERTLPSDHVDLQSARLNLAVTLQKTGDLAAARSLYESALEVYERTLPSDHPDLQRVRKNLAVTIMELGDLQGGRALFESALEVLERTLPGDHPELQGARQDLVVTLAELGLTDECGRLIVLLCQGGIQQLRGAAALSSREALALAASQATTVSVALSFAVLARDAPALCRSVFGWAETRRVASTPGGG
jgi:tetratricopeptide (TPR) repeat protein